jgi:hypothetical protein
MNPAKFMSQRQALAVSAVCHHNLHQQYIQRTEGLMKEIIIYSIAAIACLAILAYSIHMFIGGLVSPELEKMIMVGGTLIGATVIGLMARDVMRTRRKNLEKGDNGR